MAMQEVKEVKELRGKILGMEMEELLFWIDGANKITAEMEREYGRQKL